MIKLPTKKELEIYARLRKRGLSVSDADQDIAYRRKISKTKGRSWIGLLGKGGLY